MEKKSQKLQKVLAALGLGSRREIEGWIEAGRVKINDEKAKLGARVNGDETIQVDNKLLGPIDLPQKTRILMYHKRIGEVSTRSDPEGRPTVFDQLPSLQGSRWIVVGRLDITTSGLLLFTNNGEVANTLMHPSGGFKREYMVRVFGDVNDGILKRLREGVELSDGLAKFDAIEAVGGKGANRWYRVQLSEGRNREVRRMWESEGVTVSRLIRTRFGKTQLPKDLELGEYLEFNEKNVQKMLGIVSKPKEKP